MHLTVRTVRWCQSIGIVLEGTAQTKFNDINKSLQKHPQTQNFLLLPSP